MNRLGVSVAAACGLLLGLAGVLISAPAALGPVGLQIQSLLDPFLSPTGLSLAVIGVAIAIGSALVARGSATSIPARPNLEAILGGVNSTPAGAAIDRRLARITDADGADRNEIEAELREELWETAVTVLSRTEALSPSTAREQLGDGSWTDDPQAAAFFSSLPPPIVIRIREWLSVRSSVEQRLERVMTELESRMGFHGSGTGLHEGLDRNRSWSELESSVRHRVDGNATGPDDRVEATARATPTSEDGMRIIGVSRRFGFGVGLASVAVGLVTSVSTPYLLGLLAIGYSLTKYLTGVSDPAIEVTRELGTDSPVPGDVVEVCLTVENAGEQPLLDLRVVDGAPDALRIVDGSPSMATSLQPGEQASIAYSVGAKRGTFTFNETQLIARDFGNAHERVVGVTVQTRLTGATHLDDLELREQASQRIGAVKTDRGGSGVEFFGTREYRPGDPMSRVNWNQLAKTGELTTVEFREQRAPTVAIVLDQRDASRLAPASSALDGVDLSVYAAEQAFLTLLEAGTEVGLITYGERLTDVEPASDPAQRALVQSRLRAATDRYAAALGEGEVDASGAVFQRPNPDPAMIDHHVPRNAQVMLLSPATDDFAFEVTERLAAFGHPVTLLSPAAAATRSLGARQRRLNRECRLAAIRNQGVRVIDWHPAEPIQIAIARATQRETVQ